MLEQKINKEFELEIKIAKILAHKYYSGTKDKHNIKSIKFDEYLNKSLINWIPSARGIIRMIEKQVKDEEHHENTSRI